MENQVSFDKLGIGPFNLNRVAFSVGNIDIYWYAVLITAGMLLAVIFACRYARRVGLKTDYLLDAALWGIPFAILGARIYYIIFALDEFRNADGSLSFSKMINVRDGGLAIYGGVIAAVIVAVILCKVKKISFLNLFDICSMGLLIGQGIGRWGNFVNCEAHGTETDLPWGMSINGAAPVHPTFLYESLWCLIGFVLLYLFARKWQKHHGEVFFGYLIWYGAERAVVEGLRTDSLYVFTAKTAESLGFNIRVSQLLSAILFVVGIVLFILARKGVFEKIGAKKKTKETCNTANVTDGGNAVALNDGEIVEEVTEIETVSETEEEKSEEEGKTENGTDN
ncbi:MAG: prolipoprotein diacylglyceryl transferase [Eubacteriales bacterium]|nr:prolipoprotein diacylglyceryl transferase [Eubacteriales bacterium]